MLVVGLIAQHHHGVAWYVLSAACGSTIGALILALVSRNLGEESVSNVVGKKRYEKLKEKIGKRGGFAVALAGIAPPPFPFTMVIAGVAALNYPIWRILLINFLARGARFTVLAFLALKFGTEVMRIAKSTPFQATMIAFIALCLLGSGFSIWRWLHRSRQHN
jgi:undecaprenyl-diphosphatase